MVGLFGILWHTGLVAKASLTCGFPSLMRSRRRQGFPSFCMVRRRKPQPRYDVPFLAHGNGGKPRIRLARPPQPRYGRQGLTLSSNNSPPPLIVTMTSRGRLSPWSKRIGIAPMSIELWHELSGAIPFILTLYNISIYRHSSPLSCSPHAPRGVALELVPTCRLHLCNALGAWAAPHGRG